MEYTEHALKCIAQNLELDYDEVRALFEFKKKDYIYTKIVNMMFTSFQDGMIYANGERIKKINKELEDLTF